LPNQKQERSDAVFDEIKNLVTESRNPDSEDIDTRSIAGILQIINDQDKTVAEAVARELPYIEKAVELVVEAFKNGGRLFYIGAGTSGRLGILDAVECPPTFGTDPEMVQCVIAGGTDAIIHAKEGSEDQAEQAIADLLQVGITGKDVACGIAASQRTPYVMAAIAKARDIGARTIYLSCNPRDEFDLAVDVAICPVVGPEVVMGSTRMKAGTATKLVLNMISTTAMICLGKVYGNMMVDLQMNSRKLEERSKRTVMMITGVGYKAASDTLREAGGHVKTALVMILASVPAAEAARRLEINEGFVRKAIQMSQK